MAEENPRRAERAMFTAPSILMSHPYRARSYRVEAAACIRCNGCTPFEASVDHKTRKIYIKRVCGRCGGWSGLEPDLQSIEYPTLSQTDLIEFKKLKTADRT